MALIKSFLQRAPVAAASLTGRRQAMLAATSLLQKSSLTQVDKQQIRHAGASALACGIATVALGGVAQGIGSVFAALVVGTARNPAIKDDLFAYTMIGFGMVELIMFIVIIMSVMLLISE